MSLSDLYYQMEQPLLRDRGELESITLNVFHGCPSDDCDSVRSDGTEEYSSMVGHVSRRKRKLLQPRRAAMYGSEVEGGYDSDTQFHRSRKDRQHAIIQEHNVSKVRASSAPPVQKPAPVTSKSSKPTSSTAVGKASRKPANPACGPCDNCGTTTSPQWRHGSKEKPIVCNACGIRYLRTGSFEKAPQSDKRRTGSGGPGAAFGGGKHQSKRMKNDSQPTSSVDTWPEDDLHDDLSRPASRATFDSRRRSKSPLADVEAMSPYASPAISGMEADAASAPPSPMRIDELASTTSAGNSSMQAGGVYGTSTGFNNPSQQQQQGFRGRGVGQTASRLGPSPLGRVGTGPAAAPAGFSAHTQSRLSQSGSNAAAGSAAGTAAASNITAAPAGTAGTAAGAAGAPAIQPELLQLVSVLAARLGSVDAAIAYIKASQVDPAGSVAGGPAVPNLAVGTNGNAPAPQQ